MIYLAIWWLAHIASDWTLAEFQRPWGCRRVRVYYFYIKSSTCFFESFLYKTTRFLSGSAIKSFFLDSGLSHRGWIPHEPQRSLTLGGVSMIVHKNQVEESKKPVLFWPHHQHTVPFLPDYFRFAEETQNSNLVESPLPRYPSRAGQSYQWQEQRRELSIDLTCSFYMVGLRFDNKDRLLAPDCLIDHLLFTKQFVSIDDTDLPYLKQLLITSFTKYTWMIPKTANPNPRPYQQSHCTMSPIWPRVASEVCCSIPLLTMERRRDPNPAFFLGELRFLHILESWRLQNYRNSFLIQLV